MEKVSKMRIAQVVLRYPPAIGGGATHVKHLAEELCKFKNVQVDVYTSFFISKNELLSLPKIEEKGSLRILRYRWIRISQNRETFYFQPLIFFDILKKKYDIVHVHGFRFFPFYGAFFTSLFTKLTLIATLHHNPDFQASFLSRIYDNMVKHLTKRFLRIIALTNYEKKWLIEKGVCPERIVVIPNGIPAKFFEEISRIKTNEVVEFRRKMGIEDKFVLVFLGRIVKGKNLELIIRALKLLAANIRKNILFLLAGPDWGELDNLLLLACKLKVKKNVLYLGTISEKEKVLLLKASDIFLMPSKIEAFSLATLEAMAAGLPILALNAGGLQDLVKHDLTGYLLENNPNEWCEYILFLLQEERLRRKLGKEGRKNVKKYKWEEITKKLVKVYEEVIE